MRSVFGHGLAWALVWLSTNALAQQHDSSSNTPVALGDATVRQNTAASDSSTRQATCRSATINYITHSLPQQCLTSTRSSSTDAENTQHATAPAQDTIASLRAYNSSIPTTASALSRDDEQSARVTTLDDTATSQERSTTTEILTSTTTIAPDVPSTSTEPEPELETDSPLDNANFLSFDEWKKQNLAKAGQSPDHVGQQSRSSGEKQGRTRPGINNALDVLGEDSEIELDFSGFGGTTRSEEIKRALETASKPAPDQPGTGSMSPGLRSKDAGKTCKERSNYASFDCAATVLKSNPECKSTSSILIENKDSYMLNICNSANKFFIVELCDDILIDTIVLANYEFFSSIFRTFRISVSDRYPVRPDRWKELGVFEARNTREVQAFLIEQPLIWARYLRIEFLTHYGNEYYCPVSLLRVHGTTMMEEFRHEEKTARGDNLDDSEADDVIQPSPEPLPQQPPAHSQEADKSVVESLLPTETPMESASQHVVHSTESASPDPPVASNVSSSSQSEHKDEVQRPAESSTQIASQSEPSIASASEVVRSPTTSTQSSSTEAVKRAQSHHEEILAKNGTKANTLSTFSTSANTTSLPPLVSSSTDSAATVTPGNSTAVKQAPADAFSSISNTTDPASSSAKPPSSIKPSSTSIEVPKQSTSTSSSTHPNPTTQESFFKSIHKRLQTLESNATLSLQYIEAQSLLLRDAFSKVEKRQIRKTEAFLSHLNETVTHELRGFKREYDELWQGTVIELESQKEQWRTEMLAVSSRLTIVADELVFQKRMVIVQSTLLMLCLGLVLFARSGTAGAATLEFPLLQQVVGKSGFRGASGFYSPPQSPSGQADDHLGSPGSGHGSGSGGGGGGRGPGSRPTRRRQGFWRRSADAGSRFTNGHASVDLSDATTNNDGTPASLKAKRRGEHAGETPEMRFEPPTPTQRAAAVGEESDGGGGGGDDNDDVEEVRLNGVADVRNEVDGIMEEEDEADGSSRPEAERDGLAEDTALRPFETQSSPSTPSGTRDQVKPAEPWPGDISHQGVPGVSLRYT